VHNHIQVGLLEHLNLFLLFFFSDRMTSDNLKISRHKTKQKLKTQIVRMKLYGHHPIRSYNLEQLPAAVVS
jgi:hypothetical protein